MVDIVPASSRSQWPACPMSLLRVTPAAGTAGLAVRAQVSSYSGKLFRRGLRQRRRRRSGGEACRLQPVSVSSPYVIVLHTLGGQLHIDGPPAPIRIRLRIIAQRIEVRQVVANRSERTLFIPPGL